MTAPRRSPGLILAVILLIGVGLGGVRAAFPQGPPLFIELPPGALAVSQGASGFVVAGTFFSGGVFHWMPTSGLTPLGGISATAVSADGRTIVGRALNPGGFEEAAIWAGGTAWRLLGSVGAARPCDRLVSGSFGASADARVVVGLAWDSCRYARAFRWEEATGMIDLGSLSGSSTRANDVSGDGRVVVGWETHPTGFRQGAKWVQGRETLIEGPAGFVGEAFGANSDGSLLVGTNCDPSSHGPATAWAWTQGAGLRCFPLVPPSWAPALPYQVHMYATSDDGRVIGGALTFGLDAESVIWLDGQPFLLRDYLRAHGQPDAFLDWYNTGFVTDVSADGRVLVGSGAGPRTFQGWMVLLPELGRR
jgi:probable HAF family extracellular repeat protein